MTKLRTGDSAAFPMARLRREGTTQPFGSLRVVCTVAALLVVTAIASTAQTLHSIASFDESDGAAPDAALVQGSDGNLYGTTNVGGASGYGTVFKISVGGTPTVLHSFEFSDGAYPLSSLIQGTDGNFYGTTSGGGTLTCYSSAGCGTVFKITPDGVLTTLYSFVGGDGNFPFAGLVQASNGKFYGTAYAGGVYGMGAVFEITADGTYTTLHSFCTQTNGYYCTDGAFVEGGLVQAANGNLYGTTYSGGVWNSGILYQITTSGSFTLLHDFCYPFSCLEGSFPRGALVQAPNGALYGTTTNGGANFNGAIFETTTTGDVTPVLSFSDLSADGSAPNVGLVQATDGNFYGSASGGTNGDGTLFEITPAGALTLLHTFDGTDGNSSSALVQATNGSLYGATSLGGIGTSCTNGCGTVFSLAVGLGPFIETIPTSGKVGSTVTILGNSLTGTTGVTFNGVAATFTMVSGTEITALVPTGATSGKVVVMSPAKTLKSNLVFRVMP